jgi:hypothetical protein
MMHSFLASQPHGTRYQAARLHPIIPANGPLILVHDQPAGAPLAGAAGISPTRYNLPAIVVRENVWPNIFGR